MKKSLSRIVVLLPAALLFLFAAGCGGLSGLIRSAASKGPAPNRIFIHPNPVVGDFAEYATDVYHDGKKISETTVEVSVVERRGALFVVKTRFTGSTDSLTRDSLVDKVAYSYLVDRQGEVKQAWYHDLYNETTKEIRVVEPGAREYVRYKSIPIAAGGQYAVNARRYRITRLYRSDYKVEDGKVISIVGINPAVKFGMVASTVVVKDEVKDIDSGSGLLALLLKSASSFEGMKGVTRLSRQGRR